MFARKSFIPLKNSFSTQVRNASYRCVVSTTGNQQTNGTISSDFGGFLGSTGQGLRLEQVNIDQGIVQSIAPYISAITINGANWSFGTVNQSKAITSVKLHVNVTDPSKASLYEIYYKAHFSRTGDTAWVTDGVELNSNGNQLEALQILLRVIA